MSEEVPDGWVDVSLGELLREPLRNGHSARPSLDGSGVRALTLTAVTYGEFSEKNTKMTVADPTKVADLWLEPGDLLIERSNTPELVGTARLYRGPRQWAIFPDLLIRARLLEAASPDYVEALLLSHGSRNYFMESAQGTAGSMPKIDQGVIERLRVPLPPLVEQSRIVEMVDALLAQLSAARQRLASVLLILKRFRQSVLAAACSGKLTEDWRQRDVQDEVIAVESSLPNSWSGATLGELATLVTSGSRGWAQHYSDVGPLFIRAQDINTDALVLDEVAHVRPPRGAEGLRTRVAPGDLLVTITGANVTRTA